MLKNKVWVSEQQAEKMRFIPQALKKRKQFCCYLLKDGKKLPINPITGRACSTTNPETWVSYAVAVAGVQSGKYDGIGFVLSEDDDFVFIDFDHVVENGKIIDKVALNVIPRFSDTYGEYSCSGSGCHIITRGRIPKSIKTATIEIYDKGRYVALTGQAFFPFEPTEHQNEIDTLYSWLVAKRNKGKPEQSKQLAQVDCSCSLSASEIIDKASASKGGDIFKSLYDGNWEHLSIGDCSQSAADLSLMNKLCFWTAGNADMMMEIFRSSGLFRDERKAKLALNRALQDCREYYRGAGR
jgi:putative DNA primase/helicase